MTLIRLKPEQLPIVKMKMLMAQDGRCAIASCRIKLSVKDACMDHDHKTGSLRSVLCRNCNGIEGRIKNLATRAKRDTTPEMFLRSLLDYWDTHSAKPSVVLYPLHRTTDEKREKRNAKARKKRAIGGTKKSKGISRTKKAVKKK
jgi:hypothetical protein